MLLRKTATKKGVEVFLSVLFFVVSFSPCVPSPPLIMRSLVLSLLVFSVLVIFVCSDSCPDPLSIQDPFLPVEWNWKQYFGPPYYELGAHDETQPERCGCQRSVKSLAPSETYILDNFTILCPWDPSEPEEGKIYINNLSFNFTDEVGVLEGHWALTGGTTYPDTICAFGKPYKLGDPYRWIIEFQCVEKFDEIIFIGVNFYARDRVGPEAELSYQEMLRKSHELGIDKYWNTTTTGMRRINQQGCYYE